VRKKRVNVYIPKELDPFILKLQKSLGLSISDLFLLAFLDYVKEIGLIKRSFCLKKKGI